jgi:hypothetical protein
LIDQRHVAAETDSVEHMVRIIRQLFESIQQHDLIRLDRSALKQDMPLTFEHRHLRQGFRHRHACRSIDDHAQRAFRAMLTEQDDCLPKIGIAQ